MKFTLIPFTKSSLYLYAIGTALLMFAWADHQLNLSLVTDTLRAQLFILSIIIIASAAIINLTKFILSIYLKPNNHYSKNNLSDDR